MFTVIDFGRNLSNFSSIEIIITCPQSPKTRAHVQKRTKRIIFGDEFVPVNKIINTRDAYQICVHHTRDHICVLPTEKNGTNTVN